MNTYSKFAPNVFLAKCTERHEKGEVIELETKYGKINECIVFNLIYRKEEFFFYSIVRADGFNAQEFAQRKADRLLSWSASAEKKSDEYYDKSNKDSAFLGLAEPIKIGHHSERRHRKIIKQAQDNTQKFVDFRKQAEAYEARAEYWKAKTNVINLSMPESIEYYEYKVEEAKEYHEGLKSGKYPKEHSYSMPYAKKAVNEAVKNLDLAKKLWE